MQHPIAVFLLSVALASVAVAPCHGFRELHIREKRALMKVYQACNGVAWKQPWTNMLGTDPCNNHWPGVWCDNKGFVKRLYALHLCSFACGMGVASVLQVRVSACVQELEEQRALR